MNAFLQRHRIFKELGPLGIAVAVVLILLFSPLNVSPHYSQQQLDNFAANPWSRTSFIGYSIKDQAFSDDKFLPILGSSELEHFDAFHPSVWADKYDKSWTPFLAGKPGTQSLTHFFYLNSMSQQLKNRKLVFIISPQWFKPQGIPVPALENFTSKGEVYSWLRTANPHAFATQQLAQRLMRVPSFTDDMLIKSALKNLARQKKLNPAQRTSVALADQFWKKEDLLFSFVSTSERNQNRGMKQIRKLEQQLPENPTPVQLNKRAYDLGEKAANNNPWGINNEVWNRHRNALTASKGRGQSVNYLVSPEWTDFQQLLNQLAANHNDVQFVIQPVNGKWDSDYAGFSYGTFADFATKIKLQLNSQGFHNVLDLTPKYYEPYYSGDTIHMGTRGWLAMDRAIDKFVDAPFKANYHLNNARFLSQKWATETQIN